VRAETANILAPEAMKDEPVSGATFNAKTSDGGVILLAMSEWASSDDAQWTCQSR
jgi:hypothetical protein